MKKIYILILQIISVVFIYPQGITITTNGKIECIGSASIEITDGNFINNGIFLPGTSKILMQSIIPVEIGGNNNITFYKLAVNAASSIELKDNIQIIDSLILINGALRDITNTYYVYFTIGSKGVSKNNGYVDAICKKEGNEEFLFPTGNNGYIGFLKISAPEQISDVFTCRYYHANPSPFYPISSRESSIMTISTNEYWMLNRENGSSSVQVTLFWNQFSGVVYPDSMIVTRWDGSKWVNHGATSYTGTSSSGSVSSTLVSQFSPFTLGSTGKLNPLPLYSAQFQAHLLDTIIELSAKLDENIVHTFPVVFCTKQNSISQDLVFVKPSDDQIVHFDSFPNSGINLYALYGINLNGDTSIIGYTQIFYGSKQQKNGILLYPNPCFTDKIYISSENLYLLYQIKDLQFNLILEGIISNNVIDVSTLKPGTYIINFPNSSPPEHKVFIKL